MTTRIVVVSAGLSQPSSTRLLADRLADAATRQVASRGGDAQIEFVELREHAHAITDAMLTGFAPESLRPVVAAVESADALIVVTPVFTASYSGLFKSFVDILDKDSLTGRPVLIAATAGTARHSLVLEHALRPLFAYLRAVVVPTAVFAATEDFGGTGGELASRVDRAARELAALVEVSGSAAATDADERFTGITPRARGGSAPMEVTPFAELLARGAGR